MRWRKLTPVIVQSDCRRYYIVKYEMFDGELDYMPHFRQTPRSELIEISPWLLPSFKDAERVCMEHHAQMEAA